VRGRDGTRLGALYLSSFEQTESVVSRAQYTGTGTVEARSYDIKNSTEVSAGRLFKDSRNLSKFGAYPPLGGAMIEESLLRSGGHLGVRQGRLGWS
jgi:hypothetical protein